MSKRKTVLFLLSVLLAGWAVYSCSMDELEAPAFEDSGRYGGFGAREARAYFEAHATDLSVPRFDPKPGSKSSWRDNIELIPEWGEAMETGHSAVSLIEVPLKSYTDNIGKEIRVENGEYGKDHQQELTRRLIIARHDTCQTDMFIITIVPSMDYGGDVVKSVEDFRYLGGGDFTGYVFCSTLEGEFVKAFGYTNGRCNGQVYAIPASRAAELKKERPELFVNSKVFRFQELPRLSQKTYTKSSDWGDDDWCEHGLSPGSCSICNGGGITRCQHGNNIETCSLCNSTVDGGDLDEVVVVVCPGCGTRDGCTCQICPGCLQKMYKCKCTYCIRCEKPMSLCDCFIYPDPNPDPDPDPTPGTGIGGDNQGNGENPTTVGPIGELPQLVFSSASRLTAAQWKAVDTVLLRIKRDCMGERLIGELVQKKIAISHNTKIPEVGRYDHGTNQLVIKEFEYSSGGLKKLERTLFHELLHSVQSGDTSTKMNQEIEVRLAIYRYCIKYSMELTGAIYQKIDGLSYALDENYNIVDREWYDINYQEIVDYLEADDYYTKYPESSEARSLDTIKRLAVDC